MNRFEKVTLFKISVLVISRMFGLFVIFPVFSIHAHQYQDSSALLIGLSIGAYGLTQALFQIPFGLLSDRYGRKPVLIVGLLLFLLGSIVCSAAENIYTIILGRMLQGLGAISSVLMAFIADTVRQERRTTANAIVGFQIGAAFIVAILLAPVITTVIGIKGVFITIAILALVSVLVSLTLPTINTAKRYQFNLATFRSIINVALLRLNISAFLLHIVMTSLFVSLPIYWINTEIMTAENHWQIYLPVMALSFVLMIPLVFLLERRQQIRWTFNLAIVFIGIACALLYYYQASYLLSFMLLTIFFTGFNTLEAAIPALVAKNSDSNKYGLTMGFHNSFQFLGAFIGGSLGGLLLGNFGENSVFLAGALIALAWLIFMNITHSRSG